MKETKENTTNRRVYKILNLELDPYDDCWGCPYDRHKGKKSKYKKCHKCHPLKGTNHNWKEFRKKQYKC